MNYSENFMESLHLHYDDLILASIVLIAAFSIGIIANRLVSYLFNKIPENNKDSLRGVILNTLRGIPFVWITVTGLYLAINIFPLGTKIMFFIDRITLVIILISWTIMSSRVLVSIVRININKIKAIVAPSILYNVAQITCYAIGFLIILQSLGISVMPVLTALGIGGVTIALGLKDTISNLIAGIHILLAQRIKPGQYIKLTTGEEGIIDDINWRDTTLRNLDNHLVIIPNAAIYSTIVTNYALPGPDAGISIPVAVSYDSDLEHVEQVTKEVALDIMNNTTFGLKGFEPSIRYNSFGDSNINFVVTMRGVDVLCVSLVRHEFIKRLYARYKEEGIEISYPVVVLQKENEYRKQLKLFD